MAKNSHIAFLFNASHPIFKGWYGGPCEDAVFKALFKIDKKNSTISQVKRGDIIVGHICETYTSVTRGKDQKDKSFSSSATKGTDKDRYIKLYMDLIKSLEKSWHTTNDDDFAINILSNRTYVISFPTLSKKHAKAVDKELQTIQGYNGAVEIDSGNPLHKIVYMDFLFEDTYIRDGKIHTTKDRSGYPTNFVGRESKAMEKRVMHLYEEDFMKNIPPAHYKKRISKRGKITKKILIKTDKKSHYQNLAHSIFMMRSDDYTGPKVTFRVPDGPEKLDITKEKLKDYVLNVDHPSGKHKAKLFGDLLNIKSKNWNQLKSKILKAVPTAKVQRTRITGYGIQYHVLIPVKGNNRRTKIILTSWIIEKGKDARLTTAFVADKKDQKM